MPMWVQCMKYLDYTNLVYVWYGLLKMTPVLVHKIYLKNVYIDINEILCQYFNLHKVLILMQYFNYVFCIVWLLKKRLIVVHKMFYLCIIATSYCEVCPLGLPFLIFLDAGVDLI